MHDRYGLLPHVVALCESLAEAGLSALAVDLYDGRSTTDEAEADLLMDRLDGAGAREGLTSAVRHLRGAEVMAPRISAVSFSMGGMLVLDMARSGLFDAVVAYYATASPQDAPLPCPVQLHLADVVDFDPADLPQQFITATMLAGGSGEEHTYPGTQHSFANADSAYYDAGATAVAWQRTLAFIGA